MLKKSPVSIFLITSPIWWVSFAVMGVGIAVSAAFVPTLLAIGIIAFAAAAAILWRPVTGFYLLLVFFLIQASSLYETYGLFANSYTLADVVAIFTVLAYFVRTVLSSEGAGWDSLRGRTGVALGLVALYFGWNVISTFWSPASLDQIYTFMRTGLEAGSTFLLAVLLLRTSNDVRRAAGIYAITGIGLAVYTIITFSSNFGFQANGGSLLGPLSYRGGLPSTFNANELSVNLMLVPGFAYLAVSHLGAVLRTVLVASTLPFTFLALLILTSRGTIISAGAAILVALVLSHGYRNRLVLAAMAGAIGVGVEAILSSSSLPWYVSDRITEIQYDNFGGRLPGWQLAWQLFTQHPIAGLGALGFQTVSPNYVVNLLQVTAPHNDYFGTLANQGLIGFILLLAMLLAIALPSGASARRDPVVIMMLTFLLLVMNDGDYLTTHWMFVVLGVLFCYARAAAPIRDLANSVATTAVAPTTRFAIGVPHPPAAHAVHYRHGKTGGASSEVQTPNRVGTHW